jgi:O-antigen ligase
MKKKTIIITLFYVLFGVLTFLDQGKFFPYLFSLQIPFVLYFTYSALIRENFIKLPLHKPIIFLVLILFLNLIFSSNKINTCQQILIYLSAISLFYLGYNLNLNAELKKKSINIFLITTFILSLPFLYYRFIGTNYSPSALDMLRLHTGHIHFSSVLLISTLASLLTAKYYLLAWFSFCLFLTNSISGWLTLAISLTLVSVNFFKLKTTTSNLKRKLLFFNLLILGLFVLASYYQPGFLLNFDPIWQKKNILGGRIQYNHQAVKGFYKKPLLGWGLDNFSLVSSYFDPFNFSEYTHNFYLQLLSETGIIGMGLFLFLIFKLIKNINFKDNKIILILIFASAIESLFDYGWQFPSLLLLLSFWLGMIIKKQKNNVNQKLNKIILFPLIILMLSFNLLISKYLFNQNKYNLAVIFNPLDSETYLQSSKSYPQWLINYLFSQNPSYWREKYNQTKNIDSLLKLISLSPKNPKYYLEIPKAKKSLRQKKFNDYYQLTKNYEYFTGPKYLREKIHHLFTQGAILSLEEREWEQALDYIQAIFKTGLWIESDWKKIEKELPENKEFLSKYHQVYHQGSQKLKAY